MSSPDIFVLLSRAGGFILTTGGVGLMWKLFTVLNDVKQWARDVKDNHLHTIEQNTSLTADALKSMAPSMATLAVEMGKMREHQVEQSIKDAEFKGEVRGAIQSAHKKSE